MSGRLRLGARVDHPAHARTTCPVAAMMAVMVVPLGRLNSASTAACFDLSVA
jgi:hypothetical protein